MKHIVVVAAIIVNQSRILCMQRGEADRNYISYKYEFPGGKVEAGETKTQALKRELLEEMGIIVEVTEEDFFMTVNHKYPGFVITMHSYICHISSQNFIRREHIGHKWVNRGDLDSLDWAAADIPIVKKLMEIKIC